MGRPRLPRPLRQCQNPTCGQSFEEKHAGRESLYCSNVCKMQALASYNTQYPQTAERLCDFCHQSFQATHKAVRQGKGRFCSRACKSRAINLQPVAARLEAQTIRSEDPDGCWLWTGHHTNGYAVMSINGTQERLSRYLFMQDYGTIPDDMMVRHTCDNRGCIRLSHLISGTALQNAHDKFRTNSQAKKLTPDKVRFIRELSGIGFSHLDIALRMDVSKNTIGEILRGHIWSHVS